MKRIDFLGASGVGKSTIYYELIKKRSKQDKWITSAEAKTIIAKQYLKENKKSIKDFILSVAIDIPYSENIQPLISNHILNILIKETLWQKAEDHHDFLLSALEGAKFENREPLHRLMGLNWFFSVYKIVILLENSIFQRHVVFDESLSQKVYGVTLWRKGYFEKEVVNYFNKIPLPAGLIYCELNAEKTLQRIRLRRKISTGHRYLSDDSLLEIIESQIEIAKIGVNVLCDRGVEVMKLNSENTLVQSVNIINNFIKDHSC